MVAALPVTVSDGILLEAQQVWSTSKRDHRDSIIRVGGLLAQFILARMREADGLPEAGRVNSSLTRERSMRVAAESLCLKLNQAYAMVRVAKVVELLGDPGDLSYSTVRAFTVFVRRKPCKIARGRSPKGSEVLPSESEVWEVKIVVGHDLETIYRQAVDEDWESTDARRVIAKIDVQRRGGRGPTAKDIARGGENLFSEGRHHYVGNRSDSDGQSHGLADQPSLQKLGRETDPKDLVDMVMEMVLACPRADELKSLLLARIR